MKSSFIELIRSAFGPKDERFRQRLYVFLICLIISVIIWFSIKLANNYNSVIDMRVGFTNLPKNKALVSISDSLLRVEVVEKGSDLFRMQYFQGPMQATISLRNISLYNKNGEYEGIITPSSFISDIEHEHGLIGKIVSIKPDTIYLTFQSERSKKVPVRANLDLTFEKEYMLYGSVIYEPESVTVKGPSRIIERIDTAIAGTITYHNLNRKMVTDLHLLDDSSNRMLEFSPQVVKVTIPVEKFTESEIDTDIEFTNTNGLNIKTFPAKVKVYCKVALKDYARLEPGMFRAVADFSTVNTSAENKVRISLDNYPDFVQISKIEPEKAEFIIIK
jgi:hypothetical protein